MEVDLATHKKYRKYLATIAISTIFLLSSLIFVEIRENHFILTPFAVAFIILCLMYIIFLYKAWKLGKEIDKESEKRNEKLNINSRTLFQIANDIQGLRHYWPGPEHLAKEIEEER